MANTVNNILKIEATQSEFEVLVCVLFDEHLNVCFNNIIPCLDGNYWDVWGTNSESMCTVINGDTATFDTKWSPPSPVIKELSRQFPTIKFWHTVVYDNQYPTEYNIWVNGENINAVEEDTEDECYAILEEEYQSMKNSEKKT